MQIISRNTSTFRKKVAALALLALGLSLCQALAMAQQSPGTFTPAGNMTTARYFPTATLLPNGKVLIAGGYGSDGALASADLYDPSTGTFTATGSMTRTRTGHTATLLPNGKVLIAGGISNSDPIGPVASAELYDPFTGTFTATNNMITAHVYHTATLLGNGKVLIAGVRAAELYDHGKVLTDFVRAAELYDPITGTFAATETYAGTIPWTELAFTATLLADGRVLIAWINGDAELYDPGTGTFSLTGKTNLRAWTATLLTNGKVLIAGGYEAESAGANLYDPSTGTFTATGNLSAARTDHTTTLLPDGTVLVAGSGGKTLVSELYDPVRGTFSATGDMVTERGYHKATLLNNGQVLVAGGIRNTRNYPALQGELASAELYNPPLLVPAPVLFSLSGEGPGQGAILHATTHQLASADSPAIAGEALEIYLTGLADGSVIPPQVSIGGRMAEMLYFGNAPGLPGVNQVNVRVPDGVAPGAAVPVRLMYLGRPSNEVTIAVR